MAQRYSKYFRGEIRRGKGGKLSSLVLLILLILFAFSTVAAATCTYTLSPTNYGFSPSSGLGTITVTPSSSSCTWTATSINSWITIASGSSTTGDGTVTYSVAANTTGSARKGTITVAGQTIIIRQAGSTFTDDPQNVYTPYIYSIYVEGITVGCGSAMYCPSNYVTRGQMAAFIIRSKIGETFNYTQTPYYSDVPSTNTFFKYVQKLKDEGITTTTGTYMVDDIVPREQMAAFIIRALYGETFSYTTAPYFSDVASTSVFYKYVQKLKDDAITTTTGTYMASSYVTRDQMAAFLGRAFLGMGNDRTVPSAPTGVIATPGNGQVTVSWAAAAGATSYNIYWSTTSGVTKTNGTKISSATSPYTHTSRTNGTTYYYIVTAVNSSGESVESAQVSATPTAPTDGGVWNTQTIDQVNAGNISAAIDANNAIHVCYNDLNRGLKYATNKTGTWVSTYIQQEDVNTIVGGGDIAVDGNNNAHIVYFIDSQSYQGEEDMYYATNSSGSWIKTKIFVAPNGGIGGGGIVATSNGKVHIAFGDGESGPNGMNVKYLNNISGSWSAPVIVGTFWPSVTPRLAIDSNGYVYIAYEVGGEYPLIRLQVVNPSGSLVSNIILDGAAYDYSYKWSPNIAIDKASNLIYVSYYWLDPPNDGLLKLYSAGRITTIDSCDWTDSGIAVDQNGKVYISIADPYSRKLKYATNKSGSWVVEELPTLAASRSSDIVIESTGKIHLIYYNGGTYYLSVISK